MASKFLISSADRSDKRDLRLAPLHRARAASYFDLAAPLSNRLQACFFKHPDQFNELRLAAVRFLGNGDRIRSIGPEQARFGGISQTEREHLVNEPIAQLAVLNREYDLDAPKEIARHPISAANEHFRLAGIFEIENSAVFQKAVHNTPDRN